MEKHTNIYLALAAAQSEMGPVVKGATNPHFKSKYADLSDVMQVAVPALNKHGIAVWHSMSVTDGGNLMRTTLSHGESDTHVHCDVPLIVSKNDMQGMKSATTYAKRIGVESLTGIAPEDDDGNAATQSAQQHQQHQQKPQEADAEAIQKAVEYLTKADSLDNLKERWGNLPKHVAACQDVIAAKDARKSALQQPANDDLGGDEIPH